MNFESPKNFSSHTGIPSSNLTNASSNSQLRNSFQDIPLEEIVKLLELIPQQLDMKNYNETCINASSNLQLRNSFQDIPLEEIVKLLELIPQQLDMKNYNETCIKAIIRLNSALKQHV